MIYYWDFICEHLFGADYICVHLVRYDQLLHWQVRHPDLKEASSIRDEVLLRFSWRQLIWLKQRYSNQVGTTHDKFAESATGPSNNITFVSVMSTIISRVVQSKIQSQLLFFCFWFWAGKLPHCNRWSW